MAVFPLTHAAPSPVTPKTLNPECSATSAQSRTFTTAPPGVRSINRISKNPPTQRQQPIDCTGSTTDAFSKSSSRATRGVLRSKNILSAVASPPAYVSGSPCLYGAHCESRKKFLEQSRLKELGGAGRGPERALFEMLRRRRRLERVSVVRNEPGRDKWLF